MAKFNGEKRTEGLVLIATGALIMLGGIYVLIKYVNKPVEQLPEPEMQQDANVGETNVVDTKEANSKDLWSAINKETQLPEDLSKYVTGYEDQGLKVYFVDVVDLFQELLQTPLNQSSNTQENWELVLDELNKRVANWNKAYEEGLLTNVEVGFDYDNQTYKKIQAYMTNKYTLKVWEVEFASNADITADEIGTVMIELVPDAKKMVDDEALTQAVRGKLGSRGSGKDNTRSYIKNLSISASDAEEYQRLLPSLVAGDVGDWSVIIEMPSSQPMMVKYAMAQIESIE